jgi:hypothetical protein
MRIELSPGYKKLSSPMVGALVADRNQGGPLMIHRILVGVRAGEMAKAIFAAGNSMFPPLSLEPDFVNCFRVFSKLEVVTAEEQERFDSMLREVALNYGDIAVRHDVGAYLGVIGHAY